MDDEMEKIEILFVGEPNAGKTSIINRFVNNEFYDDLNQSSGISCIKKITKFSNGNTINIIRYDFAGGNKKIMMDYVIKTCSAIVLVYCPDTLLSSHKETNKEWIKIIKEKSNNNRIIALVLNKIDTLEEKKDYYINSGKAFALEENLLFFTTSAAENKGINELYEGLINKIKNWKDVKLKVEEKEEKLIVEKKEEEKLIVEDNKKTDSEKKDKKSKCPCF